MLFQILLNARDHNKNDFRSGINHFLKLLQTEALRIGLQLSAMFGKSYFRESVCIAKSFFAKHGKCKRLFIYRYTKVKMLD